MACPMIATERLLLREWRDPDVVPFIEIDKGLEDEENGVQLMKDETDATRLRALLDGLMFLVDDLLIDAQASNLFADTFEAFSAGFRLGRNTHAWPVNLG